MPSAAATALFALTAARWFGNGCGSSKFSNMADAWKGWDYLDGLGETNCGVPDGRDSMQICLIGNAHVVGVVKKQRGSSSYCRDVVISLR
ncbi:hypothetical protein NLG97_g6011 [Lecanicillium saksenae]|uniref:Uncharacterized protein n=1 Tax=Lecanicillium saksenae TaxID=468837 RepID=A0ACC1QQU7_9HYPO|nr:hypothetical protein NLG97_g6011 [Lecanicillium saksenae]